MKSKKRLLRNSRLYVIVDKQLCAGKPLLNIAKKIKNGGGHIIQLRDKVSKKECILRDAYALGKSLSGSRTIFIVNDFLDVAKLADSDGIHLGQKDIPIAIARKILGKDKIIGLSCHNLMQALRAQESGADYISIGPVFATATKPEYKAIGLNIIGKIRTKIKIPFFVIGGINPSNAGQALSQGAERMAVSSAICKSGDVSSATRTFAEILKLK